MMLRTQQGSSGSQVTTISHQGVADFSPAAVPTPVGAPGAGSGLAGISTVFEEPLQPETAAPENKQAMTIYVKTHRFINQNRPRHNVRIHRLVSHPASQSTGETFLNQCSLRDFAQSHPPAQTE
jgi:hypothetical protein